VTELQITEREHVAMTRDLDEVHHATLPDMHAALSGWREVLRRGAQAAPSRRAFIAGAGAAGAAAVLAACSKTSSSSPSGAPTTTAAGNAAVPGQGLSGDLAVAALAAALENTAVATYQAGIDAASAGKLGKVPPAVVTFAKTAQAQHADHANAWNAALTGAGKRAIPANYGDTTVYTGVVKPAFAAVTDAVGLAKLALALEGVAAATYLASISGLHDSGSIKVAATIQPVEMQHVAILNFVLGTYPVPDSFAKTDGARTGTDQIGPLS